MHYRKVKPRIKPSQSQTMCRTIKSHRRPTQPQAVETRTALLRQNHPLQQFSASDPCATNLQSPLWTNKHIGYTISVSYVLQNLPVQQKVGVTSSQNLPVQQHAGVTSSQNLHCSVDHESPWGLKPLTLPAQGSKARKTIFFQTFCKSMQFLFKTFSKIIYKAFLLHKNPL